MAALVVAACSWPAAAQDAAVDPERRAYELFQQSEVEYRAGRFAAAVALLEEANRLDPEPVLVYNLARAYEGMGELDRAIDAYRRYLSVEPQARDRGAIEARLATLTRQLEERRALDRLRQQRESGGPDEPDTRERSAGAPATRRTGPERDRGDGADDGGDLVGVVPWIVAGVGLAGVVTGAVVGAMANARHDDAVDEPGFFPAMELQDDAEGLATVANVAFVAGGIVLATGVTWGVIGLVGRSDDESRRPGRRATGGARRSLSVAVLPTHDGGGIFLRTSWP